ncbi:MAG TPA: DNA-3-methyladenine glycosylase 2 family protein [Candidatus Paceibacterota bacterium]
MTRRVAALKHFKRVDPHFHKVTSKHHTSLPMQLSEKHTRAALFEALVSIVISQQLGTAVADVIFARVKKACGNRITPESVLKTAPAVLRTAGLSGSKVKTLTTIATAVRRDQLDLLSLKKFPEADAAEKLMQMWGLGPWSVEMFMMFALGRGDIFSVGDLGLVRAMETIYNLPKNTSRSFLLAIAEKWSPHRTYASLLLWATRDSRGQVFTLKD